MKKLLIIITAVFLMAGTAMAGSDSMGWSGPVPDNGPVTITDETVYHFTQLDTFKPVGFFSLQAVTTGAGTVTITYEVSNVLKPASSDYVDTGATAIVTAKAAGTGFYQFPVAGEAIFAKWIRLKLVATGAVGYVLYPNVQ